MSEINKLASASRQRNVTRVVVKDKEGTIVADVDVAKYITPEVISIQPVRTPVRLVGCKWCGFVPHCAHRPRQEPPRPPLPDGLAGMKA
jgi:hypothetical protein